MDIDVSAEEYNVSERNVFIFIDNFVNVIFSEISGLNYCVYFRSLLLFAFVHFSGLDGEEAVDCCCSQA